MFTVTPSLTKNQFKSHSVVDVVLILKEVKHRCEFVADTFYRISSFNTRSASGASLPESANGGQIDWRVFYHLFIYIMLSREGKYLKIINCLKVVIYFVMFYTYDVSNRPISGNIADNE